MSICQFPETQDQWGSTWRECHTRQGRSRGGQDFSEGERSCQEVGWRCLRGETEETIRFKHGQGHFH